MLVSEVALLALPIRLDLLEFVIVDFCLRWVKGRYGPEISVILDPKPTS